MGSISISTITWNIFLGTGSADKMTAFKTGVMLFSAAIIFITEFEQIKADPNPDVPAFKAVEDRGFFSWIKKTVDKIKKHGIFGAVKDVFKSLFTTPKDENMENDNMICFWNDERKRDERAKKEQTYNKCRYWADMKYSLFIF